MGTWLKGNCAAPRRAALMLIRLGFDGALSYILDWLGQGIGIVWGSGWKLVNWQELVTTEQLSPQFMLYNHGPTKPMVQSIYYIFSSDTSRQLI